MRKAIDDLFNDARNGELPPWFDQWELCDARGWSVAHEAARYNRLPLFFNNFDLVDQYGWSVKDEMDINSYSCEYMS